MSVLDKERPQKVRLLPYFLVPGMDINSRLFHKAQATLVKQAAALSSSSTTLTARKTHLERLFSSPQGMRSLYYWLGLMLITI